MNKKGFLIFLSVFVTIYSQQITESENTVQDSSKQVRIDTLNPNTLLKQSTIKNEDTKKSIQNIQDVDKTNLIRNEFRSAKTLAGTGAIIYGLGVTTQSIGSVLLFREIISSFENSENTEYNEPSLDGVMTALFLIISGTIGNYGGQIITNIAGSKSKNLYIEAYGFPPEFRGWLYFGTGIGFTIAAYAISNNSPEAAILANALNLTSFGFGLASVIHSYNYTNRIYAKALTHASTEIRLIPQVKFGENPTLGLKMSTNF